MKRKQHITAFYLETLLMIVVFISIILVLTRVFGSARVQSVEAKDLTTAVTLAQNTAEAVSASHSPQELQELLEGDDKNSLLLQGIREDAENPAGAVENAATLYILYGADMCPLQISQQKETIETWHTQGGAVKMPGSGALLAETRWMPAGSEDREGLVDAKITVYNAESGREIYSLDTSVYLP